MSKITMQQEGSSPASPSSSKWISFFKATGLFVKNSLGEEYEPSQFPKGHIHGLTLSNNGTDPTNDIDIATGKCRDSTDAMNMILASALIKRLDAAWAVGTNQGGLDTGSIANTTYHIWLIKRSDTGVVDALFSASATSPTMPASYDYKRRIGSIIRESAAIVPFLQDGDEFKRKTQAWSYQSGANPGTSAITITLGVPTGLRLKALCVLGFEAPTPATDNPASILLSDLSETDSAPSASISTILDYSASANFYAPCEVMVNTSAQCRIRCQISGTATKLDVIVRGWVDLRGRLA